MNSFQTHSNEGFKQKISVEFIKKAFSTPPTLKASSGGKELIINIPQATFINEMVAAGLVDEDAMRFLKELRLVAYRNHLVEEEQKHNKQLNKKQYCKIRPICTNGSRIDGVKKLKTIRNGEKTNNSINVAPIYLVEKNSEQPLLKTEIRFTHKATTEVKRFRYAAAAGKYVVNYNEIPLGALCLLGYNSQHIANKNLGKEYKRFTSVSFAWGTTAEEHIDPNTPQYSIPLIIDRKVVASVTENVTEGSNAQEFTTQINFRLDVEFTQSYVDTVYYTKTSAVYLRIKTSGGGSTSDKPVIKPGFDIVERE